MDNLDSTVKSRIEEWPFSEKERRSDSIWLFTGPSILTPRWQFVINVVNLVPIQKWHLSAQSGVFTLLEILEIAGYSCGFQNVQALLWTKIYHFWTDTSDLTSNKIVSFKLHWVTRDRMYSSRSILVWNQVYPLHSEKYFQAPVSLMKISSKFSNEWKSLDFKRVILLYFYFLKRKYLS